MKAPFKGTLKAPFETQAEALDTVFHGFVSCWRAYDWFRLERVTEFTRPLPSLTTDAAALVCHMAPELGIHLDGANRGRPNLQITDFLDDAAWNWMRCGPILNRTDLLNASTNVARQLAALALNPRAMKALKGELKANVEVRLQALHQIREIWLFSTKYGDGQTSR